MRPDKGDPRWPPIIGEQIFYCDQIQIEWVAVARRRKEIGKQHLLRLLAKLRDS